jgi:MFS transporter, SP family, galactose:H+ symporter
MAVTVGIFLAYFADYLLISSDRWRFMLGISVIPGVLMFLAILPLGDSARWYLKVGRRADAEAVIKRANPEGAVQAQGRSHRGVHRR